MMQKTFTERVQRVVRAIPKGKTLSYKEVAMKAGSPRGARAVACIMAINFDPAIPCHRVIRSDGKLGGYNRGGESKKRAILRSEGARVSYNLNSTCFNGTRIE